MTKRAATRNLFVVQGAGGPQGPQGPQGIEGEYGGLYTFEIIDGDLYVYYEEGSDPPSFYINEEGFLVYSF